MQIWYIIGSIYSRPTHTDLFQSATCLNSFVAGKTDMICGRLLGFFQKQLGKKCFHNTVKSWRNEQVHSPTLIVIDGHIMDLWEIYFLLRDKLNEATLCREWLVITCIKLPYNAILSVWRSHPIHRALYRWPHSSQVQRNSQSVLSLKHNPTITML